MVQAGPGSPRTGLSAHSEKIVSWLKGVVERPKSESDELCELMSNHLHDVIEDNDVKPDQIKILTNFTLIGRYCNVGERTDGRPTSELISTSDGVQFTRTRICFNISLLLFNLTQFNLHNTDACRRVYLRLLLQCSCISDAFVTPDRLLDKSHITHKFISCYTRDITTTDAPGDLYLVDRVEGLFEVDKKGRGGFLCE